MSQTIEVTITKWIQAETTFEMEKPATKEELLKILHELDETVRTTVEDDDGTTILPEAEVVGRDGTWEAKLLDHESSQYFDIDPLEESLEIRYPGDETFMELEDLYPTEVQSA
jgi:hypothetical protein